MEINSLLQRNSFFIKEHLGMFKLSNNYDVYDSNTKEIILNCREQKASQLTKLFRFDKSTKIFTPFNLKITSSLGSSLLSVKKDWHFSYAKVSVFDEKDKLIGYFKQQNIFGGFSGIQFNAYDIKDKFLFKFKGQYNFKLVNDQEDLGSIVKEWKTAKEIFTSADDYVLEINDTVSKNDFSRYFLLAAVFCIDMVLHE